MFRHMDELERRETHRGLRGISEGALDDCADLNEYADVRRRLVEGPDVGSSSSNSGAARFFPFVSRTGSSMVKAELAAALRRVL